MKIQALVCAALTFASISVCNAQSYHNPYATPQTSRTPAPSYSNPYVTTDRQVSGYTRNDGIYVQPHHQSARDDSKLNNYSTQGNINPYTGQPGTRRAYP